MRPIAVFVAAACVLAVATPAHAKPNAQDASFITSAGARALTEVNVGKAYLHARGDDKRLRRFASLAVRRGGHETRAIERLASHNGLPSPRHGKRRGTAQVAHLAKLSGRRRDHSYLRLTISDLDSHIRAYRRELAKGRDNDIRKQATEWLGRLTDLRTRAATLLHTV